LLIVARDLYTDNPISGAFIVDPMNHWLGRRGEIFVTALCLTATPIGSGFARTWQELFAARFIMGIGIGAKNATVPIYSAEMAPHRIRGALVMFWQLWVVAGLCNPVITMGSTSR
jgi:MFS family permease